LNKEIGSSKVLSRSKLRVFGTSEKKNIGLKIAGLVSYAERRAWRLGVWSRVAPRSLWIEELLHPVVRLDGPSDDVVRAPSSARSEVSASERCFARRGYGERGIRTLGTKKTSYNGLAISRFRPLSHLSCRAPTEAASVAASARSVRSSFTLALSSFFLSDFRQVGEPLKRFTTKFGMDWSGST
jgi:hypothetical protein